MAKWKQGLAVVAAMGLVAAGPAWAQTRSADSLPAAAVQLDPAALSRASAPMSDANEINKQSERLLVLFAIIGALGLLIAAAAGGGGGRPDTPG